MSSMMESRLWCFPVWAKKREQLAGPGPRNVMPKGLIVADPRPKPESPTVRGQCTDRSPSAWVFSLSRSPRNLAAPREGPTSHFLQCLSPSRWPLFVTATSTELGAFERRAKRRFLQEMSQLSIKTKGPEAFGLLYVVLRCFSIETTTHLVESLQDGQRLARESSA